MYVPGLLIRIYILHIIGSYNRTIFDREKGCVIVWHPNLAPVCAGYFSGLLI